MVKYLYLVFFSFFFVSCDDHVDHEKETAYQFFLVNNTEHKVVISSYDMSGEQCIKNKQISKYFASVVYAIADTIPDPYLFKEKDCIVKLTYDDTVTVWFRNPRHLTPFDIRSKYNYEETSPTYYKYDLTEADYQYALEHREENE